ncbi:hypothetical protein M413DRAFT_15624 [Hebeloma cylindrosporum]|uniref:Aminoglycoside phosphotransferase domain-containing protein n=1 Tax=Hebeloma cylindrosporum TaxID=76867 RepID=A0A0C3D001_HEBCY|nr:hypothetical protein M413DRAFT_15624 [Hebeloma cylindrosporum h7]
MSVPSEPDFIDLARKITHAHCNIPSVSCRLHDEQGCFSKTYLVKLEDQSNIIVQFRDTPLDLSLYEVAREKLGALVPTIEKKDAGVAVSKHIYIMNYIDGSMWNSALGAWPGAWDDDAAIAGQLGDALSHCIVGPDSSEVVESYIIPRLKTVLLESIPPDRLELRRSVEELISIAPNLKKLPLALSHLDLNATNVRKPS